MDGNIFNIIQTGGWVMWPLIIFSIVSWALILEKTVSHWLIRKKLAHLSQKLVNASPDDSQLEHYKEAVSQLSDPMKSLFHSPFSQKSSRDLIERVTVRNHTRFSSFMKKNLWVLGTIGSSSPFIGLLGTVIGIVKAFHDMSVSGTGGFEVVSSGISEALIATAAGLIVAVIALLAYNVFTTSSQQAQESARLQLEEVIDRVHPKTA